MPIKRLQRETASFPCIGKLRKGAPKGERGPGQDLDHFRFDSDDRDALHRFVQAYGPEPVQINVYLPYPTAEENFQCWQEAYTAGALQHRCDGETCVIWLGPDGRYSQEPKACPGGCKEVGRLQVIVPELARLAYVTVETHSINDIIQLTENLQAAEALRGNLQGIPFILTRREREISTPGKDGKRVRRTKSLLFIEPHPDWVRLQLEQMHRQALPGPAPLNTGSSQQGRAIATQYRLVDKSSGEILDDEYGHDSLFDDVEGAPAVDPNRVTESGAGGATGEQPPPIFHNKADCLRWAVEIQAYTSLESAGEGYGYLRQEIQPETPEQMYEAWTTHCRNLVRQAQLLLQAAKMQEQGNHHGT